MSEPTKEQVEIKYSVDFRKYFFSKYKKRSKDARYNEDWLNDFCDDVEMFIENEKHKLRQELQKTREQLNLANEVILDLMQQHIGWNDNPVNAWNYTALSADEKADDYWSKYLKDKQGE